MPSKHIVETDSLSPGAHTITASVRADLDFDGLIGFNDILLLLTNWS